MNNFQILVLTIGGGIMLLCVIGLCWCVYKMYEPWSDDIERRQNEYLKRLELYRKKERKKE